MSTEQACVWGSADSPVGNWSPYVAGANTVHSGETYIKLAWNPIYLEPATPFRNKMPTWGVKVECEGHCNGLPCAIDPAYHKVNEVEGQAPADGAGGANFCVVTVPEGSNANFVVFEGGTDEDYDDNDDGSGATQPPSPNSFAVVPPSSSSPPPSSPCTSSSTPTVPTSSLVPIPVSSTPIASAIPLSTAVSTSTPPSSTLTWIYSSPPSPRLTSPSYSSYTPLIFSTASANSTSSSSRLTHAPSVKHKQDQKFTDLPAPSFSYKPHVAAGNNSATPTGSGATTTFPSNETLYSTYPGPLPGSSGTVFNKQVTFAGFGLTALAAIAVVAL